MNISKVNNIIDVVWENTEILGTVTEHINEGELDMTPEGLKKVKEKLEKILK